MTAEVVREASTGIVPTSPAQRRQLRLRGLWANYTEAQDKLAALLHEAQDHDDYKALGYPSWTAYIADTFGAEPAVRLAREKRQELVHLLSDEGMGTRAIGQALHISKNTVTGDLRRQEVSQSGTPEQDAPQPVAATPEKESTTGLDGKKYTRRQQRKESPEEKQASSEANTVTAAVSTLLRLSFTHEEIVGLLDLEEAPSAGTPGDETMDACTANGIVDLITTTFSPKGVRRMTPKTLVHFRAVLEQAIKAVDTALNEPFTAAVQAPRPEGVSLSTRHP